MTPEAKLGLLTASFWALVGCDVEPSKTAAPHSSSSEAAISPDTPVQQLDEAALLTDKYKGHKRSFLLSYTENGKRKLGIIGTEKRTEPRMTQAQLITMTRDICRQQGKSSDAVSVSNIVTDDQIMTFLKCD
ncbi:MAG: hypothetical protein ABJH07_09170 [Sedimentitalea sp.]|uniref:hypothetical protein n=1 Tax=Sedimentitalea sp. TaxID=2048915 RepID=UPI0032650141